MIDQQLDPSIQEFKQFINQYPQLCKDIHSKEMNIQYLYEKWSTLGEDDPYWRRYKQNKSHSGEHKEEELDASKTSEFVQTLMNATKNMDMAKVQTYVDQMSSAVMSVQEIVQEFNKNKTPPNSLKENTHSKNDFFRWMRD